MTYSTPSTTTVTYNALPTQSPLQHFLLKQNVSESPDHPPHLQYLANTILFNLAHEHNWTHLRLHTTSTTTNLPLPRPLISGLPPKRIYIHPDEQIALIRAEHERRRNGNRSNGSDGQETEEAKAGMVEIGPEREWVLPTHIEENWSLARFAELFDAIDVVPDGPEGEEESGLDQRDEEEVGRQWRGKNRQKRLMLSVLHDDSTVVYYVMHDGIVKPRQN